MSSKIAEFDLSKQFNNRFLSLEKDETEGIECDCEFIIGPQNAVVKGHKFLFSAASKVFRDIFYGNIKINEAVRIHELDLDAFQGMKQFIYTGYVDFKSSIHALYTYTAALKYVIPALSSACIAFIEKNGIPPCEVLEFYEYCKTQNILGKKLAMELNLPPMALKNCTTLCTRKMARKQPRRLSAWITGTWIGMLNGCRERDMIKSD